MYLSAQSCLFINDFLALRRTSFGLIEFSAAWPIGGEWDFPCEGEACGIQSARLNGTGFLKP
jgi:hypothetical protein